MSSSIHEIPDTNATWIQKFTEYSGITPTPSELPFAQQAAINLSLYQKLIEINRERLGELQRSLDVIVNSDPQHQTKFKLTSGQVYALDSMSAWLKTDDPYFVLKGFAGTGKSYIISFFAKSLSTSTALFTAPTNKATKVLKELLPKYVCRTIYSALSLKMTAREDEMVLTPSEHKFNLNGYSVVFIDESSMLNSEVMRYVRDAVARYGLKVVFICDLAQLPPVGEDISPVAELKVPTAELTEVVRHNNQILTLATHVRNAIVSGKKLKPIDLNTFEGNRTVWKLSAQGFIDRIHKTARRGFEDCRAIAWRNRTVDNLNDIVRSELYGENVATWEVGDNIVITEPIGEGKKILATIDDEGIIVSVDVGLDKGTDLDCYFINVKMENGMTLMLRVIHEDSERPFKRLLADIASQARKPMQQRLWREFWAIKNRFHSIRHSYAITSHRSQGSSIQTVFVDASDILANPDRSTAYRCLYVALSRASHKLFVTGLPQ